MTLLVVSGTCCLCSCWCLSGVWLAISSASRAGVIGKKTKNPLRVWCIRGTVKSKGVLNMENPITNLLQAEASRQLLLPLARIKAPLKGTATK